MALGEWQVKIKTDVKLQTVMLLVRRLTISIFCRSIKTTNRILTKILALKT